MSDLDTTIHALKAALEISPFNLPLRIHLADLMRTNGRIDEAEQEYRTAQTQLQSAIQHKPADATLYEQLAQVQTALGDTASAQTNQALAQALRQQPEQPEQNPTPPTPAQGVTNSTSEQNESAPPSDKRKRKPSWLTNEISEDDDEEQYLERSRITFNDVGGLEDLKERIRMAIIYPFQRPEIYAMYGKQAGGGMIFYGPPGCGKTFLARATAGEVGAHFINVGINDVISMWQGQSEKHLHSIFETARRHAPSVIFFDELEAIGGNRSHMLQQHQRTLVNQFLTELDGVESENTNVLVIGATNSPWNVDPSLRRPGRFDRSIFVSPPDEAARMQILRLMLSDKPLAPDVDLGRLARDSENYSGADLKGAIDSAAYYAIQEAMRYGTVQPLTMQLLHSAIKQQHASTQEWMSTAKNYVLYSNEGGFYDEVAAYMNRKKK